MKFLAILIVLFITTFLLALATMSVVSMTNYHQSYDIDANSEGIIETRLWEGQEAQFPSQGVIRLRLTGQKPFSVFLNGEEYHAIEGIGDYVFNAVNVETPASLQVSEANERVNFLAKGFMITRYTPDQHLSTVRAEELVFSATLSAFVAVIFTVGMGFLISLDK